MQKQDAQLARFKFDPTLLKGFIAYLDDVDKDDYMDFSANIDNPNSICEISIKFKYHSGDTICEDIFKEVESLFEDDYLSDLGDFSTGIQKYSSAELPICRFYMYLTVLAQYLSNKLNYHEKDILYSEGEAMQDEQGNIYYLEDSVSREDVSDTEIESYKSEFCGFDNINFTMKYPPQFLVTPPCEGYSPTQKAEINEFSQNSYNVKYELNVKFKITDLIISPSKMSDVSDYIRNFTCDFLYGFDVEEGHEKPGTVLANLDYFLFSFFRPVLPPLKNVF